MQKGALHSRVIITQMRHLFFGFSNEQTVVAYTEGVVTWQ